MNNFGRLLVKYTNKKKRGQTTTFIVVGLLLLITIGMVVFIRNMYFSTVGTEIETLQDQTTTLPPLKTFVTECIKSASYNPVNEIGLYGGTYNTSIGLFNRKYVPFHGGIYGSLAEYRPGEGIVNSMFTRQVLEKELSYAIRDNLDRCVNLTLFERLGYVVKKGKIKIGVVVAFDEVYINASYPLTIEKVGDIQTESEYFARIDSPLGKLYDLTAKIINEEIQGGFDKDTWMIKNGGGILIEKHRTQYHTEDIPAILYNLTTKDLDGNSVSMHFAIIDRNTINEMGSTIHFNQNTSISCYNVEDDNCFFSAPLPCVNYGLVDFYNMANQTCKGISTYNRFANLNYSACVFENLTLTQGQSMCVYEGPAGGGSDYVGSRHYVVSCVFGKIYVEECKDFREEICTYDFNESTIIFEYNLNSTVKANLSARGKAVCRPNRWHDCVLQSNQADCEDNSLRDCYWDDPYVAGKTQIRDLCLPLIPPGFKFWEYNGAEVCEQGNDYRTCDGIDMSCPQSWTNALDKRCSSLGDCGANYNTNKVFSNTGFISTDDATSGGYLDGIHFNRHMYIEKDHSYNTLDLGNYNTNRLDVNTGEYDAGMYSHINSMKYFSEYLETAMGWDVCGDWFKCKKILGVEIPVKYKAYAAVATFCTPWQGPNDFTDMDCAFCGLNEELYPCTEYKCKSLGSGCNYFFNSIEGKGTCTKNQSTDTTKFNITFIEFSNGINATWNDNTDSDLLEFTSYLGVKATDYLRPNELFYVRFNTSEETKCYTLPYPTYLSDTMPFVNMAPFFSSMERDFTKEHNMRITLPSYNEIQNKTLEALNLSGPLSLSHYITYSMDFFDENPGVKDAFMEMALTDDRYNVSLIDRFITGYRNNFSETINMTESIISEISMSDQIQVLYFFLLCETQGGAKNTVPIRTWYPNLLDYYNDTTNPYFDYFKIYVNNSYNGSIPPVILWTDPINNSNESEMIELSVYTDIPAECRISLNGTLTNYFGALGSGLTDPSIQPMSCSEGGLNINSGNYCEIKINASIIKPPYYVQCRSNPRSVDVYSFKLFSKPVTSPTINESANRVNISVYVEVNGTSPTAQVRFRNGDYINNKREGSINATSLFLPGGTDLNLTVLRNELSSCYYTDLDSQLWEELIIAKSFDGCDSHGCNISTNIGPSQEDWYVHCLNNKEDVYGATSNSYMLNFTII